MNNDRKRLEDLIMRLADDQQIMAEIYEMTNRAVYIFIHGMVGNAECAKDVTQNVYLSIYQNCRRRSGYQRKSNAGDADERTE